MARIDPSSSINNKLAAAGAESQAGGSRATLPLPADVTDADVRTSGWPDAAAVKEAAARLSPHIDNLLAATAWYFTEAPPDEALTPSSSRWSCFFAHMKQIQAGRPLVISAAATGCPGAGFYLGLHELPLLGATIYLSALERLKQDMATARAFYQGVAPIIDHDARLVYQRLDAMPDAVAVEVVNLWVGPASLSALLTLANYDRLTNDNVMMPFASGCQSIWTLPYKEKAARLPRAVAGSLDPTVRRFLPAGAMSFALPANRFVEMCGNIAGSFLGSPDRVSAARGLLEVSDEEV